MKNHINSQDIFSTQRKSKGFMEVRKNLIGIFNFEINVFFFNANHTETDPNTKHTYKLSSKSVQ